MEETKKKFPSLPPNYVSLQQLQEQRLREQREKEEEEERKIEEQRLKERQQREEEEKKRLEVSEKAPRVSRYRNGRNFSQKSWLMKEKNEEAAAAVVVLNPDEKKVEEVEPKRQRRKKKNRYEREGASEIQKREIEINVGIEAEELPDPDQNVKEIETNKKKKKKRFKGKKPKALDEQETLIKDVNELLPPPPPPPPPLPSEITPVVIPNENDAAGTKNTQNGFRRRVKKPTPESVSQNQTMEIVQKIGDLRIRDDDDKKKSTVEKTKNGDCSRSRKMFNRRKPMDGNLMWIRKDDKTDSFPVGFGGYIAGKFKTGF